MYKYKRCILVDFNYNYSSHIYGIRLNSPNFYGKVNHNWLTNTPDSFSKEKPGAIPIETRAKIFSNELIRMVHNNELNAQKLQQSITKYVPNTEVKIISMENYDEHGINTKQNVGAATRPKFDKDGNLERLEIYLPNFEYGNKLSENKFIENVTHEIIHAMQFAENKDFASNYKDTPEGHFLAFFQQNIANMLIDTIVQKSLINIAKEQNFQMSALEDYDKFLEEPNPNISEEKIMEDLGYKDKKAFNRYIKIGFDVYFEELMKKIQVEKDQFAQQIIKDCGGADGFRKKIKSMVTLTLINEKEAYLAGCNARKAARNCNESLDNNDAIHTSVGLLAEALAT